MTQITFFFRVTQVSAKKTKPLLARAGKRKGEIKETETSSSHKGKGTDKGKGKDKDKEDMGPENLPAPSTRDHQSSQDSSAEPRGPGPMAKEVMMDMGVNGRGKKVAGDEKGEGKLTEVVNVGSLKGGVRTDNPVGEKRGDVGQDKKSGDKSVDSSGNLNPVIVTDNTAKSIADDVKRIPPAAATTKANRPEAPSVVVNAVPSSGTPTATKDDAKKEKVNPTVNQVKTERALDGKTTKPKGPIATDEGDAATPKRVTKELPASPPKEKVVPALGLTVPKSPKNGSAPPSTITVTGPILSPLQKALDDAENETLMERVARLELGGPGFQPQKEVPPPANTDMESDFECVTAPSGPSTPKSRAGGNFNLLLRSDVPLSDDDDLFMDCDSIASLSHFDGL